MDNQKLLVIPFLIIQSLGEKEEKEENEDSGGEGGEETVIDDIYL